jgi:hypothetical protein
MAAVRHGPEVGDVRWHLPSAVSGAGLIVAALAAHIDEALIAFAARCGSASSIVVPEASSQARAGLGWAGKCPDESQLDVGPHLFEALKRRCPRLRHVARVSGPRRGCRGSSPHNCGWARRSRRINLADHDDRPTASTGRPDRC